VKTKAAVLTELHKPFEIIELDLDGPKDGEVLIRYVAAGLCHSDMHLSNGDLPPRFPIVGGHEGSGIIEEVGAGVTKVKPGDHVVCSFIPNCPLHTRPRQRGLRGSGGGQEHPRRHRPRPQLNLPQNSKSRAGRGSSTRSSARLPRTR
jgi:threonine dehydrogenase-like Zn-dependent dehydrogenase